MNRKPTANPMIIAPKPRILDITPYKGGLSKTLSDKPTIKLSSNETPLGPSPKAIEAYKHQANQLERYPEPYSLIEAIARTYGLDPNLITCGAGSDELISLICLAYAGQGDEVLYSQYGFLMYPISTLAVGADPIQIPANELRTDVTAIAQRVTEKTKIIFIANPNNPTGNYVTKDEITTLLDAIPNHVLLVLDGAYAEYVDQPDYTNGTDLVSQYDNLIITRTFSKIYGLASLRAGWMLASEDVTDIINRVRGPFNVSGPAIAAASAAVYDTEFTKQAKVHNDTYLPWLSNELSSLGIKVYPSVANFVLTQFDDPEKSAEDAYKWLYNDGIIVRPVANYGLEKCLRITVGKKDDNDAVITSLSSFFSA